MNFIKSFFQSDKTNLYNACNRNGKDDANVVKEILSRSPDLLNEPLNESGITPLHWASTNGHEEIVQLLLSYPDININIQSSIGGYTALHCASANGHEKIVQLLLSYAVININIQNKNGFTALHSASHNGQVKIIKLLLSRLDIDINILNKDGKSAADICCEWYGADKSHREEILQLFEEFEEKKAISQAKETKMNDNKQNNKNIIKTTPETIDGAEPTTIQKGEIAPANHNVMKTDNISNHHLSRQDQRTSGELGIVLDEKSSSSPINEDEKSFEDLKFPPLLRVSIICLKILIAEEELKEAKRNKAFAKAIEINKEKKRLKSWLEESSQGIVKALPAELSSEDLMVVKEYTIKQLEDHFEECLDHDDEELLAGIDAFKAKVEVMNLISSSSFPTMPTSLAAVATIPPRSPPSPAHATSVGLSHLSISPAVVAPFLSAGKQFHVFLTHNWADDESGRNNHQRVSKINKLLKENGLITWFDEDRMKGQIRQAMGDALIQSMIVLCFITKQYEAKINKGDKADNCFFEFNLATNHVHLVNYMIPIAMERSMLVPSRWQEGRLQHEFGGELLVDMTEDDDKPEIFHQQIQRLISRIHDMLAAINKKRF